MYMLNISVIKITAGLGMHHFHSTWFFFVSSMPLLPCDLPCRWLLTGHSMVLDCPHPQGQAGVALQPEQPGVARPAGDTWNNRAEKLWQLQLTQTEHFKNKKFVQILIRTGYQYCELESVDTVHTRGQRWLNLKYSKHTWNRITSNK